MTIKVNSENLIFLNNLNSASDRLATAMSRLATGARIQNAGDDAAGFMISKGLEVKQRGLNTANNNIQMGLSLLGIAEGSIQTMLSPLYRIRDLALQSSNGVYSDTERKAMQMEVDSLFAEIKRTRDTAEFNGTKLFTQQIMTNKADTFVDNETAAAISLLSYTPASTGGGTPAYSPAPMMMSVGPSTGQETEIPNAIPQTTPEVSLMSIEPETPTQTDEEPVANQTSITRSAPMMRSAAPNPNEGSIIVNYGETQTLTIAGKTYTVEYTGFEDSGTLAYSYDETTGAISFDGYFFDIRSAAGQANNVILTQECMTFYGSDENDRIEGVASSDNIIYGEGGDDVIINHGNYGESHGGAGNDTIVVNGDYIYRIDGGSGNDTITLNGTLDEYSGSFNAGADDYTIIINSSNNPVEILAGAGNDTISINGNNNTVSGGDGSNTLKISSNSSGTNYTASEFSQVVNVMSGNSGSIEFTNGEAKTIEIAGKTYEVEHWEPGTDTLNYSYDETSGAITFNGRTGFKIWSIAGQENNVIIEGTHMYFYGAEQNDKITDNGQNTCIYGGEGNDEITALGIGGWLRGEDGDDTIILYDNDNTIFGGEGNNTLVAGGDISTRNITEFNKIVALDNEGSIKLGSEATKTLEIAGKTYTIQNKDTNDASISYNYNSATNTITFAGNSIGIQSINGQANNVIINGNYLEFFGAEQNDTITVIGNNNTVSGGAGENTLNIAQGVTGTNYTASEFTTINDANLPDDEPANEGSISLASHERTNIVIAGKTYELYNWGSNPTTLDYSYDETTGAITFNSFMLEITSASGQENNVILEGTGVYYRGSDEKDTVLHKGASGYVWAEGGDDIITTEGSSARVYGAGGNDTINSTGGYSYIYGGEGNDNITSAGDDSEISGDSGNDTINASGDYVYIYGGTDNDNITSSGSDCEIWGEGGDDTINANGNDSYIYGESGNDTINVSDSSNSIDGGSGDNTLGITGSATDVSFSTDEFSKIVALENSGSINLDPNEEATIEIAGYSYTVQNYGAYSQNLEFSYDEATNEITFNGFSYLVKSVAGQENNVIIQGDYMNFYGVEKKDTVKVFGNNCYVNSGLDDDTISITGNGNSVFSSEGDDIITINGDNAQVESFRGDDTIIVHGANASVASSSGNDRIEIIGSGANVNANEDDDVIILIGDDAYIAGNKGNDGIDFNGNNSVIYGGTGDDTINVYGEGNTIDGGAGNDTLGISSGTVNPNYSNTEKIRALDNTGSLTFASGGTSINFEIDGKEYFIWSGEAQTVNYSLENGVLTLEGNSLYIESTKDQDDNLNILGDLNEIYTFEGNDKITLSGEENTVFSGGGNDTVVANGDYSCVYTEDGNDTVTINGNNSLAELGNGDDKGTIYGDESTIGGSYGNDTMTIIGDQARISDSEGDDLIAVEGDNAEIYAGAGDDLITVEGDNAEAYGEEGDDTINITGNNARAQGDYGDDIINVWGNNATRINGGIDNDIINVYGSNNSEIVGAPGDDKIQIIGDDNTITSGAGNDSVSVDGARNNITLNEGNDSATILGDGNIVDCGEGYDVVSNGGTNTTIANCNELWKEPEPFVFQVGTEANANSTISVSTGFTLPVFDINISNADSARASLDDIDKMIEILTGKMAEIGVSKNRLESALSANEVTQINITAARSNIVDADIAQESMELLKAQILKNATASLLVTARDMNSNSLLNIYNSLNNLR